MQSLAIIITSPPYSNLTATAVEFTRSALINNINVLGVFFYQDGALNAAKQLAIATDEYQAITQWRDLHNEFDLALHVCATAAEKRGLTDELLVDDKSNIHKEFTLSGLGELVELTTKADRVVQL